MVCFSMSERTEALLSASMSGIEAQVKAKEEQVEAAIQALKTSTGSTTPR